MHWKEWQKKTNKITDDDEKSTASSAYAHNKALEDLKELSNLNKIQKRETAAIAYCILNNDNLPIEIKKDFVLFIVHFIQFGDASGGVILNIYNDLVNCLL